MAWEWSHTPEAYRDAEYNFRHLPNSTLAVIYAEWAAMEPYSPEDPFFDPGLNDKTYRRELRRAHSLIRRNRFSERVDAMWDRISELATCTNGGWEAHCCPFGCGCHMVPFHVEGPERKQPGRDDI